MPSEVPVQVELPSGFPIPGKMPSGVPVKLELPSGFPVPEKVPSWFPIPVKSPARDPTQGEVPSGVPAQEEPCSGIPSPEKVPSGVPVHMNLAPGVPAQKRGEDSQEEERQLLTLGQAGPGNLLWPVSVREPETLAKQAGHAASRTPAGVGWRRVVARIADVLCRLWRASPLEVNERGGTQERGLPKHCALRGTGRTKVEEPGEREGRRGGLGIPGREDQLLPEGSKG